MRKFKLFVLLLGIFSFLGLNNVKATPGTTDVVIQYYLNGTEQTTKKVTLPGETVGGTLTYNPILLVEEQPQQFMFWTVNGAVRKELPQNLTITIPSKLILEAHFASPTNKAAVFLDTNLRLLKEHCATSGTPTAPVIPGKPLATTDDWALIDSYETKTTIAAIDESSPLVTYYVARYQVDSAEVAGSLTVDTILQSQKAVNEVVTLTAPSNFSHWTDGEGNVLSYKPNYTFSMLKENRVVNSVTGSPTPEPLVNMVVEPSLRTGYLSIVGQFENNDGYTALEAGFIISRSFDDITLDSLGVTILAANTFNANTNEFLSSFKDGSYNTIRAYAIFDNGTNKVTKYSAKIVGGKQPLYATDLIISEYIGGSGSNKAIEIYNGTGSDVDLSNYRLELYMNGATTPSYQQVLSGTLAHGDVYIVAHAYANAEILALADITSSVAYFDGDDAIALVKIDAGERIDVFGVIGERPNPGWPAGNGTTRDQTLVRKPSVTSPTTTWDVAEWDCYPVDTIINLGSHPSGIIHEIEYNVDIVKTIVLVSNGSLITYAPPKDGHTFDGWFLDNEHTMQFNTSNPVNQSLKLYAKWTELPQYTVSFESNGGSTVPEQTIYEGYQATPPASPAKSGYVFGGWYSDYTLGTLYDFTTPVTTNITLYAKWNSPTGTLMIYEVYGDSGGAESTYKNDYIILYNGTSSDIDLTGYYINLGDAAGSALFGRFGLSGTISAGGYFKIQLKGGSSGADLPFTPDFTIDMNVREGSGKVALTNVAQIVRSPNDSHVLDFVGYGSSNMYEGLGAAPAISATTSIKRTSFLDYNQNSTDFVAGAIDLSYLTP